MPLTAIPEEPRYLLDRARQEVGLWKSKGKVSGAVRTAKLKAHYDEDDDKWWFELMLSVGFKPGGIIKPQRIVGVHIDPHRGWFISILGLDGTLVEYFQLDESRIARLVMNLYPEDQARLKPSQRTAKEQAHRYADAIVAVCQEHSAICAVENISYRRSEPGPHQLKGQEDNSRTIFTHLKYKLALQELPPPLDIWGVSPRRDCAGCGHRHDSVAVEKGMFYCQACGQSVSLSYNAACEVGRRALWTVTAKKPSRRKKVDPVKSGIHKTSVK